MAVRNASESSASIGGNANQAHPRKGMILPFQPLSLAFNLVNYYVDMPNLGTDYLLSFFLSFWNLFSGFMIPRPQIPVWWRWYYWCSPLAWTVYGLVTSQVGDKDNPLEVPGSSFVTVKSFLKDNLGFEYDFLKYVALAHVGWVILFTFVFAYGIKFLNF